MNLKATECEDVEYNHVTQDRVQWRALVNTAPVIILWVPKRREISLLVETASSFSRSTLYKEISL
jgi:hypothetical protein